MTRKLRHRPCSAFLILLLWPSCSGDISKTGHGDDDPGAEDGAGKSGSGEPGPGPGVDDDQAGVPFDPEDPGDPNAAGPRPMRRLTRREYDRTIRDLVGIDSHHMEDFPRETSGPSGYLTPGEVGVAEATRYQEAAEAIAATAVKKLATIAPCAAGRSEAACAQDFVESFGLRAFRRPLEGEDSQGFQALYKAARSAPMNYDHTGAVRMVIAAMLQSPQFLYHQERNEPVGNIQDGVVALDGYEIASRLSYLLWGTMPDADLFAAAKAGTLATAAEVETQARRMLADRKAQDGVLDMFREWLDLERLDEITKDPKAFSAWQENLKPAIVADTEAFLREAVLEDGKLSTLLTSRAAWLDGALSELYGRNGSGAADAGRVELDDHRMGLFTRAAFLAIHAKPYQSSPVQRGVVILNRLLCTPVPPPPADVDNTPPPVDPEKQTREQYAMHAESPACRSCHELIDPYGFAFEHFDGMGQFRETEAGRPVDASGTVSLDGTSHQFDDARDLMQILSNSEEVRRCLATQWLRFAAGRPETVADQFSHYTMVRRFGESDGDFRDLLAALVTSKSFRFRAPAKWEVQP